MHIDLAGEGTHPVVLLFGGQGTQYVRMAAGLYQVDPVFTQTLDRVFTLLGEDGPQVRADWLGPLELVALHDVRRAQPLLFAVGYALGRTVLSWGVRPAALLGHSAGELVAAAVAEVFSLEDAVRCVSERVRQIGQLPAGGMLAVAASEQALRSMLVDGVAVAAVNAPRQVMLAGSDGALTAMRERLQQAAVPYRPVAASSAFHSPMMLPAVAPLAASMAGMRLQPPVLPVWSAYTGRPLTGAQATSPQFWAGHVTDTVWFWRTLDELLTTPGRLVVEAGAGQSLARLARRHPSVRAGRHQVTAVLPAGPGSVEDDRAAFAAARARVLALTSTAAVGMASRAA